MREDLEVLRKDLEAKIKEALDKPEGFDEMCKTLEEVVDTVQEAGINLRFHGTVVLESECWDISVDTNRLPEIEIDIQTIH